MKHAYMSRQFKPSSLVLIQQVNAVLEDYARQGFTMTLRQVYYQLVKANVIPNTEHSYDNLGSLITDARRAGRIDWALMEDRTRNLRTTPSWATPREMCRNLEGWYRYPKWADQEVVLEAWVEKDALLGVLERPCQQWDVPYFACRGYMSDIEQHDAAQRAIARWQRRRQRTIILHFGDHDPSGIDMTRDIRDRFAFFGAGAQDLNGKGFRNLVTVERLALTMDQIDAYAPPPNPAKLSDSRASGYIDRYGASSWELDALTPTVIADLVNGAVDRYRDPDKWAIALAKEAAGQAQLAQVYAEWERIEEIVGDRDSFLPDSESE